MSIVISCIALLGVAYSLILQAFQLRANQLQISRATQLEIVRMVIDNPKLLSGSADLSDPEQITAIGSFLNFRLKQLELSYSVKAITSESVRLQARLMFAEGYPVEWWRGVRGIYESEATTRRERQLFAIVDEEHVRTVRELETTPMPKPETTNLCKVLCVISGARHLGCSVFTVADALHDCPCRRRITRHAHVPVDGHGNVRLTPKQRG